MVASGKRNSRLNPLVVTWICFPTQCVDVGEIGASSYNFQLKSVFVKNMLDTLYLSTDTLHLLFVLMQCTIPLIFHIVVM